MTYEIDIKRVIKRRLVMAIGDARMLVDGREIYVASDLRVGLFKREMADDASVLKEDIVATEEIASGVTA